MRKVFLFETNGIHLLHNATEMKKKQETRTVITCRPKEQNKSIVFGLIDNMGKKFNSPSVSHTVETILIDYANNITSPKQNK